MRRISSFFATVVLTCLAILAGQSLAYAQHTLTMNVPDFCNGATITSVASGNWSSASTWNSARVPTTNDIVHVATGHTVTYDSTSDDKLACVGIDGTLTFRTDVNTHMRVGTLMSYPTGALIIGTAAQHVNAGVTAEIVTADVPVNLTSDPEAYGTGVLAFGKFYAYGAEKTPTFSRFTTELHSGGTAITLSEPLTGWNNGDRVVIPGTEQWFLDVGPYVPDWEVVTISNITGGATLTTSALQYDHLGAHNVDTGALDFTAHAGNLTRNIIFRSENPTGTRGHIWANYRADVDLRFIVIKDMGRTIVDVVPDPTNNPIGRYALHMHHVYGPTTTPANGYQFTIIGIVVENCEKWGITVHDSHYGLVKDNIIYKSRGAGIMTEDGNETENVIDHNFMVVTLGPGTQANAMYGSFERGDTRDQTLVADKGYEGSGLWLRGGNNHVMHNVVANSNAFAISVLAEKRGMALVPNFKGADPTVNGTSTNMSAMPFLEFHDNEVYASADGMTIWDIGATCCEYVYDVPESDVHDFTFWHIGRYVEYGYGHNNLVFRNWKVRGKTIWFWSNTVLNRGIWFGDYITRRQRIVNPDIQGLKIGIQPPFKEGDVNDPFGTAPGYFSVEGGYLNNQYNIFVQPMFAVTGGGGQLPPRRTYVISTRFGPNFHWSDGSPMNVNGSFRNIAMELDIDSRNGNIVKSDQVFVTNYNGTVGDNFRMFYQEQAPSYIVQQTGNGVTAAPVAGLTNTQLFAQYGLAIAGEIAPCATTRAGLLGFVCATSAGTIVPMPGVGPVIVVH